MKTRQHTSTRRLAVAFASCVAIGPVMLAQDSTGSQNSPPKHTLYSSSSSSNSETRTIPRIWAAVSGSYTPLKLFTASTQSNANTPEVISSTVANGQAGGGVNVNARIYGGFWLHLGAIYRFGGYDTSDAVNNTVGTLYIERTRARIVEFPLLVRYAGPRFRWNKYAFYELGGSVRDAFNVSSPSAAVTDSGPYCCAPPSTTSIRRTTEGVVAGTGLVGKDDFGIIVASEIRYTRWMDDTFRSPTVGTQRNQLEITISFGF